MEKNDLEHKIKDVQEIFTRVRQEFAKRIVGQTAMIQDMLTGLIAGGHVLLEGVPGLAKTLAVRTLAEILDADFKRIQFTPDLLPADLIGTMVYKQHSGEFVAHKGPIFSNVILADEINRAPAKVQSALLEAMQEHQVTIGDATYKLPAPFFVLATQNPIEHEGTYPLPEAQLDRFMFKLRVSYPCAQEELDILSKVNQSQPAEIKVVLSRSTLSLLKEIAENIQVDERISKYIVSIVFASREKDRNHYPFSRYIEYGASPRASIYLYRCAKVKALMDGRSFVLPEDVKQIAYDVMRHRIVLSYEAESEELTTEDVIKEILSSVAVP